MIKLKNDKIAHLVVGAVVALIAHLLVSQAQSLLLVAWMAWEKELYDRERPQAHTCDGWDAFATLLGGVIALAVPDAWTMWMGVF